MPPILTISCSFFFILHLIQLFTMTKTGGGIGVKATQGAEARLKGKSKKQRIVGWIGVGAFS